MVLESIWHDARYAIRSYLKAPSLTVAIVTTLALGIGASTAIFSMVNGILLQPLPLPDPDTLVYANEVNGKGDRISVSWPNYVDWRARARSFEALANSREEAITLTGTDRPERLRARRVTGNFFHVIRVQPARGRGFTDDDDLSNSGTGDDCQRRVLANAAWRGSSVLGRMLKLDDVAYTVVGVLPQGFEYPAAIRSVPADGPHRRATPSLLDRGNHMGFNAIGRLKRGHQRPGSASGAGVDRCNARTGVSEHQHVRERGRGAARRSPGLRCPAHAARPVRCRRLPAAHRVRQRRESPDRTRRRAAARARRACGARRRTDAPRRSTPRRKHAGIGRRGGARRRDRVGPAARAHRGRSGKHPAAGTVRLDGTALLFAFAAAAICGIVFGAFPALQASGLRGQHALVRGGPQDSPCARTGCAAALMIIETALALMLLTGAGLMSRTLQQLTQVDTGFRPDHLLTTRFMLAGERWNEDNGGRFTTKCSRECAPCPASPTQRSPSRCRSTAPIGTRSSSSPTSRSLRAPNYQARRSLRSAPATSRPSAHV